MVIVNYDKKWPDDFLKIKDQVQKVLTVHCKVQHVGSTSIPGMKAKPIIDIDVGLENWNDFEKARNELAKIGYEHEGNKEITGREAFGRSGTEHNEILVTIDHYLYVCSVDNEEYNRHILFHDYLRDRPYVYNLTMKVEHYISTKMESQKVIRSL